MSKRQWGKKLSAYYDTNDLHLEDERFGDSDEGACVRRRDVMSTAQGVAMPVLRS